MRILIFPLLISTLAVAQNNPVVIELFTSQGCSSCPAADKNLAEILGEAEKNGQPVFGLSYHVDYWNYIGWKDPYSNPDNTTRQRMYSQRMHSESIYTPQMIVNGEIEFVGSNKKESREAVVRASTKKMSYLILLGSIKHKAGKVWVPYTLEIIPENLIINAAIVERSRGNDIPRGENAGRKLTHRNVVRSFASLNAQRVGVIEIDCPDNLSASSIIVFIQDNQWHIKGATSITVNDLTQEIKRN